MINTQPTDALEKPAKEKGIPIYEPFAGSTLLQTLLRNDRKARRYQEQIGKMTIIGYPIPLNQLPGFSALAALLSALVLSLVALFSTPPAFAETKTVVGQGSTDVCFSRETALKLAHIGAENDGHKECSALGDSWRYTGNTFAGYEQCFRCGKSEEFKCKVTQAMFQCTSMKKENEEKAAREKAARDAAANAAKEKAAQEKAEREARQKAAKDKADRELAAAAKARKDKADREFAARADKDKKDKEAAAHKESQHEKPVAGKSIDDAFATFEKQTGRTPAGKAAKVDTIDAEFAKMEESRAEQARQKIAAQRAKERRDEAVNFCTQAMKSAETCMAEACGKEPPKMLTRARCAQYADPGEPVRMNAAWKSGDLETGRFIKTQSYIIIPKCWSEEVGPNEKHAEWEVCTRRMSSQCAGNGKQPTSLDACVSQRLR